MDGAWHVERPRKLENRYESGIIEREIAIVGQQRDATNVWQREIALQLRGSFRTNQRVDGRGCNESTVALRGEIVGHCPVVPSDDIHGRLVRSAKRSRVVWESEDQTEVHLCGIHDPSQLAQIGPTRSHG